MIPNTNSTEAAHLSEVQVRADDVKPPSLWTRGFIIVSLVNLLVFAIHFMLTTTLPEYAIYAGGTSSDAGIIMGMFTIAAVVFRPPFGGLVDRFGRRFVLISGAAIMLLAAAAYPFFTLISGMLLIRFVHGIGFSAYTSSASTVIADIVPPARLSEGIGYFTLSNTIAMGIGPVIGLAMAALGYPVLFGAIIALSIFVLLGVLFVKESRVAKIPSANEHKKDQPRRKMKLSDFAEKSAVRPAVVMFFLAFTFGSTMSFLPLFGLSRGIESIGTFFTVFAVTMLMVRVFTSKLIDRIGPNLVIIVSTLFIVSAFIVLAFAQSFPVLIFAAVLYGLGSSWPMPALNAVVIRLASPERRGAANATFFTFLDLGVGLGTMVLGFIAEYAGFFTFFIVSSVFCVTSLVCYLTLLVRRLDHKQVKAGKPVG